MKKILVSAAMWAFIVFVPAHISFAYTMYDPYQYQLYWCNGYYSYAPCYSYSYPQYQYYYPSAYYTYPQYYYTTYHQPYSGYSYGYNYNYNYNGNYAYDHNSYWW